MIRLVLICDMCSAVGPQVDAESAERGAMPLADAGRAAGWSLRQRGHGCPDCDAKGQRTLESIVSAGPVA